VANNNMYSIKETDWPRQCSRCNDSLGAGRSGDWIQQRRDRS